MSIEFSVSDTSKTFAITILDDEDPEEDETFTVTIKNTSLIVKDFKDAVITILDNDRFSRGK